MSLGEFPDKDFDLSHSHDSLDVYVMFSWFQFFPDSILYLQTPLGYKNDIKNGNKNCLAG